MNHLSQSQQVGQRLMIGFDGTQLDDKLKFYIDRLNVGGVILFARNLESPDQAGDLCHAMQDYARHCGQPPLFISIDQEGGVVARLKPPFTQFEGAPHIQTEVDAKSFADITARELRQIGVNMDMAPVLDVIPRQGDSVMERRSFGHDPNHVAHIGCAIIQHLQRNQIMAVAKHFPGIGRTVLDSHDDLPDLDIGADALEETDLVPFQAAVTAQVSGIMLSHIRYGALDPQWPASLSPIIAANMLRGTMGYDGLIVTDDLDMGAIAKHYALPDVVRQCLKASVDILLICHESPKIEEAFRLIRTFLQENDALAGKAVESLSRIMRLKNNLSDR